MILLLVSIKTEIREEMIYVMIEMKLQGENFTLGSV